MAKISTLQVTGSLEHLRFSTVTNIPSVEPLDKELYLEVVFPDSVIWCPMTAGIKNIEVFKHKQA